MGGQLEPLDERGEIPYGEDDEAEAAGAGRAFVGVLEEHLVVESGAGVASAPGPASADPPSGHENGTAEARPEPRRARPGPQRPVVRPSGLTEPLFDVGPPYSAYGPAMEHTRTGRHPAPEGPSGRVGGAAVKAPAGRALQAAGRNSSPDPRPSPDLRPARTGRGQAAMAAPGEDDQSLEELVSHPGIDVETVRDLERFGLITPKLVGSVAYYSPQAAVIAQLASAFARHGVEARHLRAYKGAAEREAGMVQQVIMPLIRQRNPEAREAAAQAVEELSHLGGELRAALLRAALADLH